MKTNSILSWSCIFVVIKQIVSGFALCFPDISTVSVVTALYLKVGAWLLLLLPRQHLPVKHKKFAVGGGHGWKE